MLRLKIIIFIISLSIPVSSLIPLSVPIAPYRLLPAENCPGIASRGYQGMERADPREDDVMPAPVLHQSVVAGTALLALLAIGRQSASAKQAKQESYRKVDLRSTNFGFHEQLHSFRPRVFIQPGQCDLRTYSCWHHVKRTIAHGIQFQALSNGASAGAACIFNCHKFNGRPDRFKEYKWNTGTSSTTRTFNLCNEKSLFFIDLMKLRSAQCPWTFAV